jgi:peptidyl-prolyl cis-trans isomerase C
MNIRLTRTTLVVTAIAILGCGPIAMAASPQPPATTQPPAEEDFRDRVLVKVNGQPITGGMFGTYLASRMQKTPSIKGSPQLHRMVLNDLINLMLLAQIAQNDHLEALPQVAIALDLQRKELLSQVVLQEQLGKLAPSEESLRQAYAERYATPSQEYKAAHILVKTEDEAKAIIVSLGQGAEFAALAREKSIDSNASQGGSLGWFDPAQMVKTFSDALAIMAVGATSTTPVKTQFGWHVIKLEEKRTKTPPTYDAIRPTLLAQAQRQALTGYLSQLRSQANIEVNAPPTQ